MRQKKHFNSLHIPKALQKALPFKSKPKSHAKAGKTPKDRIRPAVIREPHERKVLTKSASYLLPLHLKIMSVYLASLFCSHFPSIKTFSSWFNHTNCIHFSGDKYTRHSVLVVHSIYLQSD